ncbi:MAG: hypothetical protein WC969_12380 [Elusimicrobiota bacterium]|jgi:hypothetical protein
MSYNIRRIDPFWKASPVVLAVAIIGAVIAMFGYTKGNMLIAGVGALAMAVGVLLAAKPALSLVLGCLGLFGGLVTFVLMPNMQTADMSLPMKLLSTLLFTVLYMVLMDALVLVVAALYNFFGGTLGGITVEFEGGQAEGE